MAGNGGRRPGAGRKKGSPNKATIERQARVAATGITPLDVMLTTMRKYADAKDWDKASAVAKDAAPYVHPRLAAVEHAGKDGGPIQVAITVRFVKP